jgi:hypothetical protein
MPANDTRSLLKPRCPPGHDHRPHDRCEGRDPPPLWELGTARIESLGRSLLEYERGVGVPSLYCGYSRCRGSANRRYGKSAARASVRMKGSRVSSRFAGAFLSDGSPEGCRLAEHGQPEIDAATFAKVLAQQQMR